MAKTDEERDLRRVLAAEGVSNFGAMLSRLAIPWLATLVLAASAAQQALLVAADVLAAAAGALLLGAWIDAHGKRAVMLGCDAARALLLMLLAAGAWHGGVPFAALVAVAAANGLLTMAFELARSAWMAQRLAAARLMRSNQQLSIATSVSETAAFALGGWLFQALGAAAALALDALSYLISALCLRCVRETAAARPQAASASLRTHGHQLLEGWRLVRATPLLRALAACEALLALAFGIGGASYMIYVARDLAIPTAVLGVIFALGGAGSVIGARLAARAAARGGAGRAMVLALAALATGAACIPIAGAGGGLAFAVFWLVAHQLVGDAGHALFAVHDRTLRQTAVPEALLARVDATLRAIGLAATLAGAAVGGWVGDTWSARSALLVSAALLACGTIAMWPWLPRLASQAEPGVALDPDASRVNPLEAQPPRGP